MSILTSDLHARERLLHVSVGVAQVALASFFAVMAVLKLVMQGDRLVEVMGWTEALPLALVRTLGVVELIGAVAVALPAVTRAPQRIVGVAALGILTLMTSAIVIHIARGELRMLGINLAVGALAAFVAWGRLTHEPIDHTVH